MIHSRLVSRRIALVVGGAVAALPLLVGSPALSQQFPPDSPTAKKLQTLVDKAAQLVDSKGKAVFPELGKPESEWRSGDTYVFVDDMKGTQIFSGGFPNLNGKNFFAFKDANGKLFFQEFVKTVQSKGSGWVGYMWPKPGQSQASQKWSYVKAVTVDGTPGLVGAGFYPQ
jgi:cytochrome c